MRYRSNKLPDDGSICAIGNGKMLIYETGADIWSMTGPVYTLPSFMCMNISQENDTVESFSERKEKNSAWEHKININGEPAAKITDIIDPCRPVFVREAECLKPLSLNIASHPYVKRVFYKDYRLGEQRKDCLNLIIPKGTNFFVSLAVINETRLLISCDGNAYIDSESQSIRLLPGKSRIIFTCGEPADTVSDMVYALNSREYDEKSERFFKNFLSKTDSFMALIPESHPEKDRLIKAFEDVSVLIKCQQSDSGGVQAGHYYPLAYVRDQAGTMRGLLSMGYIEEARKILSFWNGKFKIYGYLCNAEGMDVDSARLIFPNDEVEVPAYVILCAFEFYKNTRDREFLLSLFDMLKWAFEVQLKHLYMGMTGFSGDETYIAGRVFPREFIYQGSAESTMLFITSGKYFVDFCDENKLLSDSIICDYRNKLNESEQQYRKNFIHNGLLYANNPQRQQLSRLPRYKFGYCDLHERLDNTLVLTWLECGEDGFYRCPDCYGRILENKPDSNQLYLLSSVSLLPSYHRSCLFSQSDIKSFSAPFIDMFKNKKYISSDFEGTVSLGYDFGLLLMTLTELKSPLADQALKVMLDIVDPTGAWVEYYDNLKPYNCRCRAWESAINMDAIIRYLKSLQK